MTKDYYWKKCEMCKILRKHVYEFPHLYIEVLSSIALQVMHVQYSCQ